MTLQVRLVCCGFIAITKLHSVGLDLKIKIAGRLEVLEMDKESQLKLWIHPMDLTSDDKHNMQLDPQHIPTPAIDDRLSSSFLLQTSLELV
jgi:hypothetical protein